MTKYDAFVRNLKPCIYLFVDFRMSFASDGWAKRQRVAQLRIERIFRKSSPGLPAPNFVCDVFPPRILTPRLSTATRRH